MSNLTMTYQVDQTPDEVFAAVTDVRGWWSGDIQGDTDKLGAEFTYRYKDVHRSKQKITEFIPGKKVVWHVVDGYLGFVVKDKSEWKGTDIVLEIAKKDDKTEVRFKHDNAAARFLGERSDRGASHEKSRFHRCHFRRQNSRRSLRCHQYSGQTSAE